MKTVVLTTFKGGVGKSSIAIHLAFHLQEKNARVLFIDVDAQGNSSKTLEQYASGVEASSLFLKKPRRIHAEPGTITVISADDLLNDVEHKTIKEIVPAFHRSLDTLSDDFDYCVIDTPAAFGYRTLAALVCSDFALSPIEMDTFAIDGIVKLLQNIGGVKEKLNPDLVFIGILANRLNANSAKQKAAFGELVTNYADYLVPAKIGLRSSIPEALDSSIPVWRLDKTSARIAAREMRHALEIVFDRMEAQ
jgi:chromosome partitioning protein